MVILSMSQGDTEIIDYELGDSNQGYIKINNDKKIKIVFAYFIGCIIRCY